ncbi:MAG: SDR family oxidoreductase [Armatimonadetes bacterium]|nr:SDR family oxidoreductase [Armatimonadota bacterium]
MKTALVTGASSGIGWEIAKELARKRFDLVLVARREDKLRELAKLLQPHVGITVLVADLSESGAPQHIFEALQDRQIDILVNNAGFATYGPFADADLEKNLELLNVNIVALTHLTRLFLPAMLQRKSGQILNVASVASFFPGPLMATYYASKAYVLSFSEALNEETRESGVSVTCLCPGATTSEFQTRAAMQSSKLADAHFMSAKAVAQRGVRAMLHGDALCVPGLSNRLLVALAPRLLPRGALAGLVRRWQEPAAEGEKGRKGEGE